MLRSAILALAICAGLPASANTVAEFSSTLDIGVQSTFGEWLIIGGGFLPGTGITSEIGDVTLITGDEGGGAACCFNGGINTTDFTDIGTMAFNATGTVFSAPGEVFASGENRAGFSIANQGGAAETVTVTFDLTQSISQMVGALVGGAAASGTELTIQRDGETIYNHSLVSMTDDLPLAASFGEIFNYSFDLPASGATSTNFIISMTGGVHASSDATDLGYEVAPVPLPAGGLLLVAGLGAFGALRRAKQRS